MQKQSLQTCLCGQAITFPEGEIRKVCQCGAVWEIDDRGFWFTQTSFVPFVAKPKSKHYDNYMKRRDQKKRGKAGTR